MKILGLPLLVRPEVAPLGPNDNSRSDLPLWSDKSLVARVYYSCVRIAGYRRHCHCLKDGYSEYVWCASLPLVDLTTDVRLKYDAKFDILRGISRSVICFFPRTASRVLDPKAANSLIY